MVAQVARLQALMVVQVDRLLALTVLPLTAPQDNNMGSINRHTAAEHHQVNMVVNPRMLLQVTSMISTANTSTISMVGHQTMASLNKTRSTLRTSLAREAVTDSNLAVNQHMAGQVRNSSVSTSTISTAEHMSN